MRARGHAGIVFATVALLLTLATPALAHVTMEAGNVRPGATSEYTISVPNESETADTTTVEVQLPPGFEVTGFKPGKGWTMRVDADVLVIDGGTIAPGDRRDFRFTAINPRERGEVTFPAIQTYSDGEEVRWVGPEGSDRPAARLTITGRPVPQAQDEQTEQTEPATEPSAAVSEPPVQSVPPSEAASVAAPADPVDPPAADDEATGWGPIAAALAATALVVALLVAAGRRSRS